MNKTQLVATLKNMTNNAISQTKEITNPLEYLMLEKKIEAYKEVISFVEQELTEPAEKEKTDKSKTKGE